MNVTDRTPLANEFNVAVILRDHEEYKDLFAYDKFLERRVVVRCPPWRRYNGDGQMNGAPSWSQTMRSSLAPSLFKGWVSIFDHIT